MYTVCAQTLTAWLHAAPPQGLSRLTSLNALNLSFNPLPAFPPVVARLTALLELNLDYTGAHQLPYINVYEINFVNPLSSYQHGTLISTKTMLYVRFVSVSVACQRRRG